MIIDIESWAGELAEKLMKAFGGRLRFVGYQGSYGRGEATEESDIDIVAILDRVGPKDLDLYRSLVRAMPEGHKACGFICGQAELRCWPGFDLYGLLLDTKPVLGNLLALLPDMNPLDGREALGVQASNLYHMACHSYLYSPDPNAALRELGKPIFFCLRFFAMQRDGSYYASKAELQEVLEGREKELLALTMDRRLSGFSPEQTERAYQLILSWSGDMLRKEGAAR